ncbi:MAG: type III-B CRISPR-associated protein Cas10/Cmr2 [Nitrososphaeria archaeon]
MPRDDFFKKKIAALLHDSPGKPWIISGDLSWLGGHEEDAKSLATDLFGDEIATLIGDNDVKNSDKLAASFDRWILSFLMGGDYERGAFVTKDVKLFNLFYREKPHQAPLQPPSKDQLQYREQLSKFVENVKTIHEQVSNKGGWHLAYNTFYAIYEYLWCRYFGTPGPADTRFPTHTVFDHTYATASTLNVVGSGIIDGYMVSIDLGGVQNFISASRKLRDLWASSWLTSSLAWSMVLPFVEAFGPDILVLPTARGNPFFYHTLACMLNTQGVGEIPSDIKKSSKLAGYEIGLGYPRHAVVPATVTLILPSSTSHPEDAKLTADGKELELSDTRKIAEFMNELYLSRWRELVKSILEAIMTPKLEMLRQVFDDMSLKDSPPLSLRVAVAEIKSDLSSKEAYLVYHKAFRKVLHGLREAAGLKVAPSVALNLTEYTRNYERYPLTSGELRFYTCSVCGEVPSVPKFLKVAEEINSSVNEKNLITVEEIRGRLAGERLCPFCLIKRLSTTKKVFPQILEVLLKKHQDPALPRFPSVSSVAAVNFKKVVVDAAIKKPEVIFPLLRDVIKSREDINELLAPKVAYRPEQELLEQIGQKFKEDDFQALGTLAIGDAEGLLLVGEQRTLVSKLARAVREVLSSEPALNTYYAMIKGDGDDVGKVIRGDIDDVKAIPTFNNLFQYLSTLTPNEDLGNVLHTIGDNKLEEAARHLSKGLDREIRPEEIQELLALLKKSLKVESEDEEKWKKRLLVSPTYHATLSRSLMTLATQISNEISDPRVRGFVVYSGGDDVLAMSPVEAALNVTLTVRSLYEGKPIIGFLKQNDIESKKDNFVPSLGDLGQSFAITYAHYRYPLFRALEVGVNALEEKAKEVVWLESSMPHSPSSKKDSVIVTYVPRGGSQIQAMLPYRANDGQIGEFVREIIYALGIIDERKMSASIVKDVDEWMNKIMVAYSKDSKELAKEIIGYIVERNASTECDTLDKNRMKELLIKGLDLAWCYSHETPEERRQNLAKTLLITELNMALQTEMGARRGIES